MKRLNMLIEIASAFAADCINFTLPNTSGIVGGKSMIVKYLGHSCFQVEAGGKTLLFDPFIKPNSLASHIDIDQVKADYILLSHAHHDHMADAVYLSLKNDSTLVSNWEICSWFNAQGVHKTHPMNTGGRWKFDFGEVKLTAAIHSSSFPDGTYGGNPQGFVVKAEGRTFYYAGDTALFGDMQLTGMYDKPEFAFLPVGNNFTMNYEDALLAAGFLNCNQVIGMHYDTFPYIVMDHEKAIKTFADAGKTLHLMEIGSAKEF